MALKGKRVVIVDDCTMTRTVLKNLLLTLDAEVSEASNEIGFLNVLYEFGRKADLVIMDLTLGEVSGYELICKMRGIEEYKNIPIIVLTSSQYKQDVIMGKLIGVDDYIIKPYKNEDLVERINKALR